MIDTHAHLQMEEFAADLNDVLDRARTAGVEEMVAIGTDVESSVRAVELATKVDHIWATVGVHPHETAAMKSDDIETLRNMYKNNRVLAIGEIGLDYYYLHSPREVQVARFEDQIRLAKELECPIIVHSRDAKDDLLKILEKENAQEIGGILHCFTGDLETARRVTDMGFYVSFSGILTFAKADDLRDVARTVPESLLLVETDAPYLAPVPFRGKRNEPAFIRHIVEALAVVRNKSISYIDSLTTDNTRRAFRIDPTTH